MVFTSCAHEDNTVTPSPEPTPVPVVDKTPPTITLHRSSVDITGVENISIVCSELYVGDLLVASWTDNVTTSCQVKMTFEGTAISSGEVPEKS